MRGSLRLTVLVTAAVLICAAPAGAFTAPELYVKVNQASTTDTPQTSDWVPLASMPHVNWMAGYKIGYAFQDAPGAGHVQHAALQISAVPDGQPTQPTNSPYCLGGPGTVGAITEVGAPIQFEGSGTYTVTVSVGPPSGGPADCLTGAGTAGASASFVVDVPVTPALVGQPLVYRLKPLKADGFAGVKTPSPLGGQPQTSCARDATVNADGSLSGQLRAPVPQKGEVDSFAGGTVDERLFTRPGAWTCVARGTAEGNDANLDLTHFFTPWSVPLRFDVRSDFRRSRGVLSRPRSTRPRLRFTAEFTEAAGGGKGTLKLKRLMRCRGARAVLRTVGTYAGRFDASGHEQVTIRRPKPGYYVGTVSFSGTRFYTKSVDPNPVLLTVTPRRSLSYILPRDFPQCPGFR